MQIAKPSAKKHSAGGFVLSELSVEISIGFWVFGADDLVASLEDLWISVKEVTV